MSEQHRLFDELESSDKQHPQQHVGRIAAATREKLTQPLKWHGGKHYLSSKIIALMPPHVHYTEPYFGGGSVLLEKNPDGVSEVANDIYGELSNFWTVLKDIEAFPRFLRQVQAVPFSEVEWQRAGSSLPLQAMPDVDSAVAFFVRCRQSRAGKFTSFATLSKNRTRRRMNEQASAWITAVDGLPAVHERLRRVVILNRKALSVIEQEDSGNTLFYLDPPYMHESRVTTSDYRFEMSRRDHADLLDTIRQAAAKVMLSGYRTSLYDEKLLDWNRNDFQIDNKASSAKQKPTKTECVWCNF